MDRFSILMRHFLQAGFQERLWTELQHRAALNGGQSFREAAGDILKCLKYLKLTQLCPYRYTLLPCNICVDVCMSIYVCMYAPVLQHYYKLWNYVHKYLCNFITVLPSVTNWTSADSYCSCCSILTCHRNVN